MGQKAQKNNGLTNAGLNKNICISHYYIVFFVCKTERYIKTKMAGLIFDGQLDTKRKSLRAHLEIYSFIENGIYIVYCPALDLSAYGQTEEEAKRTFEKTFEMHFSYCLNENSLYEDLKAHGWNIRGKKSKDIKAPGIDAMIKNNPVLRDILYHKEYSKYNTEVSIPDFA
ncbi:MAG TPA: hypothetical protein DEG28_02790 [Porphyromonadaceae bacterium]|nr:hypothetical protein [Porphyromonadaceae bacterium]